MSKWMIYNKKGDFAGIGQRYGVDQVLAKIMVNRDICHPEQIQEYLYPNLQMLGDGAKLKDMARAVSLLKDAICEGKNICIIGDYDIDGIQSTYILHQGILRCGGKVTYQIPHRVEDGYGINVHMIEKCVEDGVDFIITCDNGIAAADAIQAAKDANMTVIVTDHHEVPFVEKQGKTVELLPPADAIVNPKQKNCAYPNKNICGAVVAWKVIIQLYQAMEIPMQEAYEFIENAAFATVGDVMELRGENRTIVALGLKELRQTKNIGMQTLIEKCGLTDKPIQAYHIGFVLGPCINASGRLDSAVKSLQLLEAKSPQEATVLAEELKTLNEERKAMTEAGIQQAVQMVETEHNQENLVQVVYLKDTHESVAGIIAGRLRETYEKPVFVLTDGEDGQLKGSGRSVEGFSMYEEMNKCRDLFSKFGGHPMAAGLSMPKENLEAFKRQINENTKVTIEDIASVVHIDVALPFYYLTPEFVAQLEKLEPFGNGNPKPVFAQRGVEFRDAKPIGKQGQYTKVTAVGEDGCQVEALYFGDKQDVIRQSGTYRILYYPQVNSYGYKDTVQIVITDMESQIK
ncbi:MAG: single-stranded-DNA-specific exonuclease RecJ [Lachnospiraceae bacterium]|nr:single-stranded-DNA-specific exonuclease RecJ [Lachnospiraceae bacterium]MDD6192720.1 single-stranded-DNA-specific exonuclease RecJ [Lachnospiraceae bacterium]MDY4794329.1 single-stranded-DNA-specific exonuclease RecJ [Pararoseburia sp.]